MVREFLFCHEHTSRVWKKTPRFRLTRQFAHALIKMTVIAAAKQVGADGFDPLLHDLRREGPSGAMKPKSSLDHLGKPVRLQDRARYKYARAYTIMYDPQKVCSCLYALCPAHLLMSFVAYIHALADPNPASLLCSFAICAG